MAERKKMMHIGICQGDIGGYVLLPGSPERAERLAGYLEDAAEVAYFREYRTFTGFLDGVKVSVTSTGMGGPSMAIAAEELRECGAHTMIRVGTCESTCSRVLKGELVLPNGAVRMEGVADHYAPREYPAVPDMDVLAALEAAARLRGWPYNVGVAITKACFSTQYAAAGRPMGYELTRRWEAYEAGGALCADMGCAPLFVAAGSLEVRTGAVLAVSCDRGAYSDDWNDWPAACEDLACEAAVEGLRQLLRQDREEGRSYAGESR